MTVKQLIEELKKFDPELPVYQYVDYEYASCSCPVIKVSKKTDSGRYGHVGDDKLPKIVRVEIDYE